MIKKKKLKSPGKKCATKKKFFLIFFIFLLLFLFSTFMFLSFRAYSDVLVVEELPFTANITDYVGFNLDTDMLHFGGVFPGGYSSRNIVITSDYEGYVFINSLDVDWIYVQNQGLPISPDSILSLEFRANPPRDFDYQNISGSLYIYIMKSDKTWPFIFFKGNLLNSIDSKKPLGAKVSVNISD